MAEYIRFKTNKLPKGSRAEKYVKELPNVMKGNKNRILTFFKDTFLDCMEFLKQNVPLVYHPRITLSLVHTHAEFKRQEQKADRTAVSKVTAKNPANVYAFAVGNVFQKRVYIDVEAFIDLLSFGYPTFILNLVEAYIHEILHVVFPRKSEQEIHDLDCTMTAAFLGIELPEAIKSLKASDYYSKEGN